VPLPKRLRAPRPVDAQASLDPALTWAELVAVIGAVLEGDLDEDERDYALRFLESNLPGAEITRLIEWPGEWLGNRWFEEATLSPEEIAEHALGRCERVFADDPSRD